MIEPVQIGDALRNYSEENTMSGKHRPTDTTPTIQQCGVPNIGMFKRSSLSSGMRHCKTNYNPMPTVARDLRTGERIPLEKLPAKLQEQLKAEGSMK